MPLGDFYHAHVKPGTPAPITHVITSTNQGASLKISASKNNYIKEVYIYIQPCSARHTAGTRKTASRCTKKSRPFAALKAYMAV
jgi:hypothetical protein